MKLRTFTLAAGVTALLSAQAVNAAPASSVQPVDPLVLLSLVGTTQSQAAFCGTTACTPSATMPASLPSASLGLAGAASSAATQDAAGNPWDGDWPGLVVLFLLPVILFIVIATEDGNGNGHPISPF